MLRDQPDRHGAAAIVLGPGAGIFPAVDRADPLPAVYGGDYGLDERLLEYWTVNPDKLPDIIFCGSEEDILPFIDDGYRCISYNGAYLFVK